MLHRRRRRIGRQIVGALYREPVVADIQRAGDTVADDAARLQRWQQHRRRGTRGNEHRDRRRQQPSRPGTVEPGQPHRPGTRCFPPQQAGDQESRDDEEHVDPDESAADSGHAGVEQDDGDDGNRPQAFDVGPKLLLRQDRPPARSGTASGIRAGCSRNSVHSSNDRLTGPRRIPGSTRYVASQANSLGSFSRQAATSWPPSKDTPAGGLRSDATNCLTDL